MNSSPLRARIAIALLLVAGFIQAGRLATRPLRHPPGRGATSVSDWLRRVNAVSARLPPFGSVGWVQGTGEPRFVDPLYLVQYTLAPRVVVPGAEADWILVGPGADVSRLAGRATAFELVAGEPGGLRLFRRTETP